MDFFRSFVDTLMHSLWQSALLAIVYVCAAGAMPRLHPLQKRNLLFFIISLQLLASVLTFFTVSAGSHFLDLAAIGFAGDYFSYLPLTEVLFYTWALLACMRAGFHLSKWNTTRQRYLAALVRPSAELRVFTELRALHFGIKRKVSIWYSSQSSVPITFGMFKPYILLPLSMATNLSVEETEAIILHELAHIKSRDYLFNWLLFIAAQVYFFNPFLSFLISKTRLEREKNCDVQVLNFNHDKLLYAGALLKLARGERTSAALQLAAVKKTPELLLRIRFFSDEGNLNFRVYRIPMAASVLLPVLLVVASVFLPAIRYNTTNDVPVALAYNPLAEATVPQVSVPAYSEIVPPKIKKAISKPTPAGAPVSTFPDPSTDMVEPLLPPDYLPVSLNHSPDSTKEFIYNIETKDGKLTQSYQLIFINGQWEMQPQWMVIETQPDSVWARQQVLLRDSIQ